MTTRPLPILQDRRGIALPVAIFALVMIGTLVGGVFFTARLEMRGGESSLAAMRASEAAQGGLMVAVPNTLTWGATLTDGQSTTLSRAQIGTSGSYYTISITRLNRYIYLVRSLGQYEGRAGIISGERTMAQLVKRYMPEVNIKSAATIVGTPNVGSGSVTVDGNDHTPPGWTACDAPGAAEPAIRTNSTDTNVHKNAQIVPAVSVGDTSVTNMSSILDTLFFQLASQANIRRTPAHNSIISADPTYNGDGTCNKSTAATNENWGDPLRTNTNHACETYFPIVYLDVTKNSGALGDVRIHAVGQGVLLINGNMELNAGSIYNGLILVRGQAGKANGKATITGGIVSQNADLEADGADFSGTLTINYSRCAVKTALNNLAVTAPTQYRGFMQF
jgi:hypothetical protein